jgi:hypothetical protein
MASAADAGQPSEAPAPHEGRGLDPRLWARPRVDARRRSAWPLPRLRLLPHPDRVRACFEELQGAAALGLLGATPLALASCAAGPDGALHLCRGHAHVVMTLQGDLRQLTGANPERWLRVRAELAPDPRGGGWEERLLEVTRYARRADLERDALPRTRRAVRQHPDGRRIEQTFERALDAAHDRERLTRTTRLWRPDGTWAEEEERLVRVGDRAKVDMTRREHAGARPRVLSYDYPWLPAAAYQRARQRILLWNTP